MEPRENTADTRPIRFLKVKEPAPVIYRPVDWIEGLPPHLYRVGDDGSVWKRGKGGYKPIRSRKKKDRGPRVTLYHQNREWTAALSTLVCTAFHGPRGRNYVTVHHPDPDRYNNRAVNLRWVSKRSLTYRGARNGNSVLQDHDITAIRRLGIIKDWPNARIARRYGISSKLVADVLRGRVWKHVPWENLRPLTTSRTHGNRGQCKGSRSGSAKIIEADIPAILELATEGHTNRQIAESLGVSASTIYLIVAGKTWKHVPRGDFSPSECASKRAAKRDQPRGVHHHSAKLTEADVSRILDLIKEGHSKRGAARFFGVSQSVVNQIVAGKAWKHVPRPTSSDQL